MKTTFNILTLECSSCALMIESLSEDHGGIKKAEVHVQQRLLVVEHDQAIDVDKLERSLTSAGYPIKAV